MVTGSQSRSGVYRYRPPKQAVARTIAPIGDATIEFALRFTGSLLVKVAPDVGTAVGEDQTRLQASTALRGLTDGLYVSAAGAVEPIVESTEGHRFTRAKTTHTKPNAMVFAGECAVDFVRRTDSGTVAVGGSLGYQLEVNAVSRAGTHEDPMASIGAVVLATAAIDSATRLEPVSSGG